MTFATLLVIGLVYASRLQVGLLITTDLEDSPRTPGLNYDVYTRVLEEDWTVSSLEVWISDRQFDVVYDLSSSDYVSFTLSRLAQELKYIHIVGWSESLARQISAVYSHSSRGSQLRAGASLLKALEVPQVMLISTDFEASRHLGLIVDVVASAIVVGSTTQDSIDKLVRRILKAQGVRTVLLDLPGDLAKNVLQSFEHSRMMMKGYAYICSPQASWLDYQHAGPLLIAEEGAEFARSQLDFELLSLDWAVKQPYFSSTLIDLSLRRAFLSRAFTLVNLLDNTRLKVGYITDDTPVFTHALTYPGGEVKLDYSSPVKINVSTISTGANPDGSYEQGNVVVFQGYFIAAEVIEKTHLLGRFELKHRQIECGASGYSPKYALNCLQSEVSNLGIAIIGAYTSNATLGILEAMKNLNLTQPVIGSQSTSSALSSKSKWPNFVRTIQISSSVVPGFLQFLKKYQYTKINLFYSDEAFGQDFSAVMLQVLQLNNIEVVNSPADQKLGLDIVKDFSGYKAVGQAVVNSGIRPTVLLTLPTYRNAIVDLLYDVGLRADDLLCLNQAQDSIAWTEGTEEQIGKRMTLLSNTFFFEQAAFTGPLGETSRAILSDALNTTPNSGQCQYYDSAYLLAYALKAMILRGMDYEDSVALMAQIRDTTFYGCTGKVAIDNDTNDRRDQDVDVFNLRAANGNYTGILVLKVSITSTKVFTDVQDIVWPGNSATAPSQDRLNYVNCPFPEENRHRFEKGQDLVSSLAFSYFCLATVVLAVVLYIQRKASYPFNHLVESVAVSFQDRVVLGLVVVDFIQYISHGPVLSNGQDAFENLTDFLLGHNPVTLYYWEGLYWTVLNTVLSLILLWFVFCVLIWLKFKNRLPERLKSLTNFAEITMPILGNAMFMPFISILFDVFVCIEAHGPDKDDLDFSDSFMERDCSHDCWSGTHQSYAVVAVIALSLYLPITVITRPLWHELTPDLHVMTRHNFYIQKTFVEVAIVMLRRGLRSQHRIIHGLLYIGFVEGHLLFSIARRPFNYARLNMWFFFTMILIIWSGLLCTIDGNLAGVFGPHSIGLMFGVSGVLIGKG